MTTREHIGRICWLDSPESAFQVERYYSTDMQYNCKFCQMVSEKIREAVSREEQKNMRTCSFGYLIGNKQYD